VGRPYGRRWSIVSGNAKVKVEPMVKRVVKLDGAKVKARQARGLPTFGPYSPSTLRKPEH
jgi:hypothetical protein